MGSTVFKPVSYAIRHAIKWPFHRTIYIVLIIQPVQIINLCINMSHVYLIFAYIYLLQYKLWSRIPNLLFFSLSNYFSTIFPKQNCWLQVQNCLKILSEYKIDTTLILMLKSRKTAPQQSKQKKISMQIFFSDAL